VVEPSGQGGLAGILKGGESANKKLAWGMMAEPREDAGNYILGLVISEV
jgi:hypothetical protein